MWSRTPAKQADESLKEYAIAVEVFERDASYDPAIDATVRVEAGRLRSRLREYYAEQGKNDTLVIDMPKGGYRATVTVRPIAAPAHGRGEASLRPSRSPCRSAPPGSTRKRVWWITAACILLPHRRRR